jgi:phospholipase/carboxylesterase
MAELIKNEASGLKFAQYGQTAKPTSVMIWLHGFGCNNKHEERLAQEAARSNPGLLVVVPDAPLAWGKALPRDQFRAVSAQQGERLRGGRAWLGKMDLFSPRAEDKCTPEIRASAEPAVRAVNALADDVLKAHGLADKDLILGGFSQGGVIAMHAAIARDRPCAGVISQSGYFMGADEAKSRPRMFVFAGEEELKQGGAMPGLHAGTKMKLEALGVPATGGDFPGVGHYETPDTIKAVCDFTARSLAAAGPSASRPQADKRRPR